MCGENNPLEKKGIVGAGSPPRVRGKRLCCSGLSFYLGITPACAGKTCALFPLDSHNGDHPRVCGENLRCFQLLIVIAGSPPRVRGKPSSGYSYLCPSGITPACAGKTSARTTHRTLYRDHPRVCGENRQENKVLPCRAGSPLRVRGKPSRSAFTGCSPRITPACAGKTSGVLLAQKK